MVMVGEGLKRRLGTSGKKKKKKGQMMYCSDIPLEWPGVKIFISRTKQLSYSIMKRKKIWFTKRVGAKSVCQHPGLWIRNNLQLYWKIKWTIDNFKMPVWPVVWTALGRSWVILSKCPHLPEAVSWAEQVTLMVLPWQGLWEFNDVMDVKHRASCLAHSGH